MSSFMGPLIPVFNDLYKNGVQVRGNTFRLKLLSATVDVSAMSLVKNTEHHSGKHGCGLCEDESVSVAKGRGHTSAYLCHDGKSVKRTNMRMQSQAREAFDMSDDADASVKGVKGYSVLSLVKDVDVSTHMTVDYLHGTCLGVMKAMICMWIRDKQKPYYIGNRLVEINRRLRKIKPTDGITPGPRSITNEISHLRASDFRSFLCYYGMMALKGILPDDYYVHFSMMSIAIHTLSKDDIAAKDLTIANELLRKFYPLFEVYYGQENCTIHVHNMCRHLVDSVRRSGPVWSFGCFSFESNYAQMVKYVRGSNGVGIQVIKNYSLLKRARSLAEAASCSEVSAILLHRVLGDDYTRNPDGIFKYKRSYASTFDIEELKKRLDCEDVTAMKITKTKPKEGGEILHSLEAAQKKSRISYVVSYMDNIKKYGRISYFLEVVDKEKDTLTLARIQPSVIISENAFKNGCENSWKEHGLKDRTGSHAKEIEFKGCDSVLIDVRDIVSKVLFMETGPDRGVVLPVACRWEQD
ncbi:uncharacterized protein LOC117106016 isoform X2 [Anneissia japonica]|uniref:uncharacterized protein LOC117106016 isoform X2 n=1 Tax=Anneissia japonica TaxID=1529436 RepID=UPI001425B823|nr:uncharacterized protein LOC117106016 isoform X2 [Anneissia japonica]